MIHDYKKSKILIVLILGYLVFLIISLLIYAGSPKLIILIFGDLSVHVFMSTVYSLISISSIFYIRRYYECCKL
jgi:hypothetical protein